jgi:hypothetical protein
MAKKKLPKPTVHARTDGGAEAVQLDGINGKCVAVFDNLRVLITKDEGSWLAQGLDVDYAIDGNSLRDVKKRFEDGLAATIEAHLRVHGTIKQLLNIAPPNVWEQWSDAKNKLRQFRHTTVIVTPQKQTELPFDNLVFLDASQADEAA